VLETLRKSIKAATGRNFWARYFFLAFWRLFYAAAATVSKTNISGKHSEGPEEIESYAASIFAKYKQWAGVDRFHGRIAEVGPGNVLSLAEMFLADGCTEVHQVDRYIHDSKGSPNPAICRFREPAETFFISHRGYDLIVSCAVMEHLYDPLAAIRAMAEALTPGGVMIHVIDCRDSGQFSDCFHDLSFLRVPPLLYKPLTLASGLNRVRLSGYVKTLASIGRQCNVLVARLSGVTGEINPEVPFESIQPSWIRQSRDNLTSIKPRIANAFRDTQDRDLMVSCFVLISSRH
jgi:SAM-dependent methyltransferase